MFRLRDEVSIASWFRIVICIFMFPLTHDEISLSFTNICFAAYAFSAVNNMRFVLVFIFKIKQTSDFSGLP